LSYLADSQTDRQTNKQTKTGKNITSLAEVKISWKSPILEKFRGEWNFWAPITPWRKFEDACQKTAAFCLFCFLNPRCLW